MLSLDIICGYLFQLTRLPGFRHFVAVVSALSL